jgi:hypothetical protein
MALLSLVASALAALGVVWLSSVTAYTAAGPTRCGRALQELPHLLVEVAGRCHVARQAQLWLGLRAAVAALLAGVAVMAGTRLLRRP